MPPPGDGLTHRPGNVMMSRRRSKRAERAPCHMTHISTNFLTPRIKPLLEGKEPSGGGQARASRILLLWESISQAGFGETVFRAGTHLLSVALILLAVLGLRALYVNFQTDPARRRGGGRDGGGTADGDTHRSPPQTCRSSPPSNRAIRMASRGWPCCIPPSPPARAPRSSPTRYSQAIPSSASPRCSG